MSHQRIPKTFPPSWRVELADLADKMRNKLKVFLFNSGVYNGGKLLSGCKPQPLPVWGGWRTMLEDGLRTDARLWAWGEPHILAPLDRLRDDLPAEAVKPGPALDKACHDAEAICKRLGNLCNVLRDAGSDFNWLVRDIGSPAQEAARRLLDTVARWRAAIVARRGCGVICAVPLNGKVVVRVSPGPRLLAADLDMVASVGAVGVMMVEKLRAWSDADHAEEGGPAVALGFLQTLADHGEDLALDRWAALAIPARDPAARPGLDSLRAKHPDLLANPGPCAVLRVLLADPAKLWSARALAKSDEVRDAMPSCTASARSVGRWLAMLHGAGLACAEGKGTAKRWRLGAA